MPAAQTLSSKSSDSLVDRERRYLADGAAQEKQVGAEQRANRGTGIDFPDVATGQETRRCAE